MSQCKTWFGTMDRMQWIDTPLSGASLGAEGWGTSGTFLNGGGFGYHSWASHKMYTFEWKGTSSREAAQLMKSYRDGTYGRGLIYFQLPTLFDTNVLPAHLADPSMAAHDEGPSLLRGFTPTSIATVGGEKNNLPVRSAVYDIPSTHKAYASQLVDGVFVPIPEGYTLCLGAFYEASGEVGLTATPVAGAGLPGIPVDLTPLDNDADQICPDLFHHNPGTKGVMIGINRPLEKAGYLRITALVGRLIKTSAIPIYGPWEEQARNLIPNPRFAGDGTRVTVAENLFTNPRFVGNGQRVEIRRNSATVPRALPNSLNAWSASWGTDGAGVRSFISSWGSTAGEFAKAEWSAAPTGGTRRLDVSMGNASSRASVTEGVPVTISMDAAATQRVRLSLNWHRASGSYISVLNTPYFTLDPDEIQRISYTVTPPTGAAQLAVALSPESNPDAGEYVIGGNLMVGDDGPYFDGSYQHEPDSDLSEAWEGGENESPSILTGERVAGMSLTNCEAIVSSKFGGSMRLIPTSSDNNSYAEANPAPGLLARQTLMGTLHLEAPLTGTLHGRALSVTSANPVTWSSNAPNEPGSYELRTVRTPTSQGRILFMHGGSKGSGDVYWTAGAVIAGDYKGPAFNGSSPKDDPDLDYSWSGAEDNSTSLLTGEAIEGWTNSNLVAVRSIVDGKPAARLIPTTSNPDSRIQIIAPGESRNGATLFGTRHQNAPLPDPRDPRGLWVGSPTQEIPYSNTEGSEKLTLQLGPITSSPFQVRFYHSGVQGSGDVYWTEPGLFAGSYGGDYFDATFNDSDTKRYRWAGAENNSASIFETRTRTGNPSEFNEIQSGPWIGGMGHSGCRFEGVPTYVANTGVNGGQVGYAATFREVGSWGVI